MDHCYAKPCTMTQCDHSYSKHGLSQAMSPENQTKRKQQDDLHKGPSKKTTMDISLPDNVRLLELSLLYQGRSIRLRNKQYLAFDVPADGNCFFHSLSLAIHGGISCHALYRRVICGHIHSEWEQWKARVQVFHNIATQEDYRQQMVLGNGWASACEIGVASCFLNCDINVWLQCSQTSSIIHTSKSYQYQLQRFNVNNRETENTINLLLANNHFNVIQEKPSARPTDDIIPVSETAASQPPSQAESPMPTVTELRSGGTIPGSCEPISQSNEEMLCQTRTLEEPVTSEARKLGIHQDPPLENETEQDHILLDAQTKKAIAKQKKKLNISDTSSIPDPPPASDNPQFNKAMDSIRAFELKQMSYSFSFCKICKERRLDMKMSSASICKRCSKDKGAQKMFSAENMMDPGIVPPELSGLSLVEQQLICRISPSINVHMLKHGGVASKGHCVTFPQAIDEPAQIFPKLPEEINLIRVRRQGKNDTSKDFTVRRYTVQSALFWLKNNNPAYSDIIISEERLNMLPIDGELPGLHTMEFEHTVNHINDQGPAPAQTNPGEADDGNTASGVLMPEPTVDIRQNVQDVLDEVIGPNHTVTANKRGTLTIPWPTRGDTPVSEFTTKYFFTLSFPCLFPYGTGDFHINRPKTCSSMADWAEHLLWYQDARFASHEYFKFIVHNMIMRKRALESCTYIVRQQLGDAHLTVADIKEKLQNGDQSIAKKMLYFGACLRGTSQYWAQRSKELRALIQYQINSGNGLPSFFTTGSCAEYHFKPLKRLLEMYIQQTTGQEIDLSNRSQMFAALQKNTHIVGHYFDLRTQSYFEEVMRPVFGVDTFWYRQEFAKSRGMIHWHGLCWRSDRQPHNLLYEALQQGLSEDESAQTLSEWAKTVFAMTASHPGGKHPDGSPRKDLWPPPEGTQPAPPEESNPLLKLLMDVSESQDSLLEDHLLLTNRINIHRCSDYCLRESKGTPFEKKCRMEFGSENSPGKAVRTEPAVVKDKNKCLRLEMERDHPMLVQHSQYHTQGWRANGDISIILSKSDPVNPSVNEIIATEKYVTGYACKGNEPTGATIDLFNDMVHSTTDEETTGTALCAKLLMETVKRDVSAVEASYELSALPLYRCSHQFQSVSMTGSRVLERTGATATRATPLDKYLSRPVDVESSWYNYICRSGRVPVIAGSNIRPSWPLNEDYCRTKLLLHWPNWWNISDIKESEMTWTEKMLAFLEMDICPNFVKADVQRVKRPNGQTNEPEDSEDEEHEDTSEVDQPEWMELIQPNAEYDTNDVNYDNGGPNYDWSAPAHNYPEGNGVGWLDEVNEDFLHSANTMELKIPECSLNSLNESQQFAFNLVMAAILDYRRDPSTFQTPLRLVVAGTAGSGKSYLINCLVKAIRTLFQQNKAAQVLCPTGSSANIISGVTLHSFFKVPIGLKALQEMSPPDGCTGEQLQQNCEGLVALLVDERSLVGCTTLGWMEYLCRCGMNNSAKSWGGVPVVVFLGDDVQLPPVCDSPVYNCKRTAPAALHGAMVWKEFDTAVTLHTVIRQNLEQQQLRDTLSSLRQYNTTKQQVQWLQNFQWSNLKEHYGNDLLKRMDDKGLFVFPTHQQESSHNKKKLLEANLSAPVAKMQAISHGTHASSDKSGGLEPLLYMCRGAHVMLTNNLNVQYGLYNGSMGIVQDILYFNDNNPTIGLPDVVMVDFAKYTGPPFVDNLPQLVPIVPIERRIECKCHSCKRKQIPLRLGWGTTIHRCQGMTIGNDEANRYIVIHPGSSSFESRNPGALFVALSRAKTAGNLTTDPDFAWHPDVLVNEDRLCHIVRTPTTSARTKEIHRLQQLSDHTIAKYSHLRNPQLFHEHVLATLNAEE